MNYSFNFYLLKTLFGSLTLNIWLPTSFEWKVIYLKKIKSIAQYSCFHWWPWNRFSTWGFNCHRVGFFFGDWKKDTKSIYGPTESYTTGNPVKSYVTTRATTCHQDKRKEGNEFAFYFPDHWNIAGQSETSDCQLKVDEDFHLLQSSTAGEGVAFSCSSRWTQVVRATTRLGFGTFHSTRRRDDVTKLVTLSGSVGFSDLFLLAEIISSILS